MTRAKRNSSVVFDGKRNMIESHKYTTHAQSSK